MIIRKYNIMKNLTGSAKENYTEGIEYETELYLHYRKSRKRTKLLIKR